MASSPRHVLRAGARCLRPTGQVVRTARGPMIAAAGTPRWLSATGAARDGTAGAGRADRETHFGFETVTEAEKTQRVAEVFSSVAETYDRMNDLMSFGWHRVWK